MSIGGWEGRIQRRPRRASDCQERIRSILLRMVKQMGKQMRRSQGQDRITGILGSRVDGVRRARLGKASPPKS